MKNDKKRMRIASALLQLLENDDLDDISIGSIVDLADLSRPTFYKYFDSKIDVLQYITRVYQQEVLEISSSFSEYRVNWGQLLLDKYNQSPKVFDRIWESEFFGIYQNSIYQYVFTLIKENCPDVEITESTRIAARIWSGGSIAALRSWLTDPHGITAEQFCEYYTLGMPNVVRQAFLANDNKIMPPRVSEDTLQEFSPNE